MSVERKWAYIVTFDDDLTDKQVYELGMAISALPNVERVMGPHQGTVEQCQCPDCRAGKAHPPAQMTQ